MSIVSLVCMLNAASTINLRRIIKRITVLAKDGADLNERATKESVTALIVAVRKGFHEICAALIALGCDVNAKIVGGKTALHEATILANLGIVNQLIEAGADLRARDVKSHTACHYASIGGHTDILASLLAAGAPTEDRFRSLFETEKQQEGIVDVLIKAGADVNFAADGSYPLHFVSHNSKSGISAQLLIDAGANIEAMNRHKESPLLVAVHFCNINAIMALLIAGARTDYTKGLYGNIFHYAAVSCSPFFCTYKDDFWALLLASDTSLIDAKNWQGQTPLYSVLTTFSGRSDAALSNDARWLIAGGASYSDLLTCGLHVSKSMRNVGKLIAGGAHELQDRRSRQRAIVDTRNVLSKLVFERLVPLSLTVLFALQHLELPALVSLAIIEDLYDSQYRVPMHKKWNIVTTVKHFHQQ